MAIAIVLVYIVRLFTLQLMSDDYRKSADSNAFRKEIIYPSRGLITDRHGTLLVYNEPSYNILVTMQDQRGVDTLDFCRTVGITREDYIARKGDIKMERSTAKLVPGAISPSASTSKHNNSPNVCSKANSGRLWPSNRPRAKSSVWPLRPLTTPAPWWDATAESIISN